jgi:hypothetical protein
MSWAPASHQGRCVHSASVSATCRILLHAARTRSLRYCAGLQRSLHCYPGTPHTIATSFTYQFIVTPRETWIILDKVVRQIFTDGRDWPKEDARWPLMLGRSRGHWHAGELIIEAVDMRDDMWADTTPLMLSTQARVTERIRQIDPNTLENRVVVHDPVKLTRDWEFTRRYVRADANDWPDDPELCGGPDDRNPVINGRVTVKLPQDSPK